MPSVRKQVLRDWFSRLASISTFSEGQQAFVQSVLHDESSDDAVITTWGGLIEIPSGS